jgi:hypothetical protein
MERVHLLASGEDEVPGLIPGVPVVLVRVRHWWLLWRVVVDT